MSALTARPQLRETQPRVNQPHPLFGRTANTRKPTDPATGREIVKDGQRTCGFYISSVGRNRVDFTLTNNESSPTHWSLYAAGNTKSIRHGVFTRAEMVTTHDRGFTISDPTVYPCRYVTWNRGEADDKNCTSDSHTDDSIWVSDEGHMTQFRLRPDIAMAWARTKGDPIYIHERAMTESILGWYDDIRALLPARKKAEGDPKPPFYAHCGLTDDEIAKWRL